MILLLPPSEGKAEPTANTPNLDLTALSFPELSADRERMTRALIKVSSGSPKRARTVLGLSPRQDTEIDRNKALLGAPTAAAAEIYDGVLYAALDFAGMGSQALERANSQVLIMSSLFGVVRPSDRICTYRLSGATSLPRLGRVSSFWKTRLGAPLGKECETGVILDLRSGTYEAFWPVPGSFADRAAAVKIWQQDRRGARTAVTHFSKHTKGLLARALVSETRPPATLAEVVDCLRANGWAADLATSAKGIPRLDVTIST